MFVPTQYAIALFFILLVESGALFIYTVIGLLKSNPLPFVFPPTPALQLNACQFSALSGPAGGLLQAPVQITVTHSSLVTTTIFSTIVTQANGEISSANMPPGSPQASTLSVSMTSTPETSILASIPPVTSSPTTSSTLSTTLVTLSTATTAANPASQSAESTPTISQENSATKVSFTTVTGSDGAQMVVEVVHPPGHQITPPPVTVLTTVPAPEPTPP